MIQPEAINQFADRQKRLLRQTYDDAWQQGVGGYEPDADPGQEPDTDRDTALAGLTGVALLAARRLRRYVAPVAPDPVRRAVALAPAYAGVNSMVAELATLSPANVATTAAAQVASAADAFHQGLLDWLASNGLRLDAGASVAWAGEQNGYGEAADQDGQLLVWQAEDDDRVCPDCEALSQMPPQPLSEWPSQPGDGATQCRVGCRCSLEAYPVDIQPGDTYAPQLSPDQEALVGNLMTAQANQLNSMMPDVAYLDGGSMAEAYDPAETRDSHGEWTSGGGNWTSATVPTPRRRSGSKKHKHHHRKHHHHKQAKPPTIISPPPVNLVALALGAQLHVVDPNNPAVQAQVALLALLPPAAVAALQKSGAQIYIGDIPITQLNAPGAAAAMTGFQELGEPADLAQYGGFSYVTSGGMPVSLINTAMPNDGAIALYEVGHSVGNATGWDQAPAWQAIHVAQYSQLSPFYQQGSPGSSEGCFEMFAGAFAASLTNPTFGEEQFGHAAMDYIKSLGL